MADSVMANLVKNSVPLVHGGQLIDIAKKYAIPIQQWLDLSTGIAPVSYPIPAIPGDIWQRLPEPSNALQSAAADYYQTDNLLAISGSQVIIQILPHVAAQQDYANSRVWLPEIGYQEHRKAWQGAGYETLFYGEVATLKQLKQQDIVVLINPNNPSGRLFSYPQVEELFNQVQQKNGLLIIDEAFMDCTPQHSFIRNANRPNLMVLRSIGKFFGLAGLRLGFVAATDPWLEIFKTHLGPWNINGPAQYIGQQALNNKKWQGQQRKQLTILSHQLEKLLQKTFNQTPKGTALFQTVKCEHAEVIFDQLCQQGIYVRLCDEKNALRFGIPSTSELLRLQLALDLIVT